MDTRFSSEVLTYLLECGWYPGRRVDSAVATWKTLLLGQGVEKITAAAESVLLEFGGLVIGQADEQDSYRNAPVLITIDATRLLRHPIFAKRYQQVQSAVKELITPVGYASDGSDTIFIGESGRVFAVADYDGFIVGRSFDEALEETLRGNRCWDIFTFRERPPLQR